MKLFIKTLVLTLIITLTLVGAASAQSDTSSMINVSLKPALMEIIAKPGESTTHIITFEASSAAPLAGTIQAKTLIPIDNEIDQSRRSEFDASSWVTFDKTDFIFEPGIPQDIVFTVNVPEDANPGGHYANISLRPVVIESESTKATATILPEIGASVFFTVPGDIIEQAELNSDDVINSRVTKNSATGLEFSISNTGNVHILPSPRITITKDDDTVEIIQLKPQLILPNTVKKFTTDWTPNTGYGKYQIRTELVYGTSSIPLSSPLSTFYVVPSVLHALMAVLTLPVILIALIKRKNIPRAIAVLGGRTIISKDAEATKTSKGDSNYKNDTKTDSNHIDTDAVTAELADQPSILGLPDEDPARFLDEIEEDENPESLKPFVKKSQIMSKTIIKNDHQTTQITQTSSSTIVRETKLSGMPKEHKTTHIKVLDHYELPPVVKKTSKITPQKSKRKKQAKKAAATTVKTKVKLDKKKPLKARKKTIQK